MAFFIVGGIGIYLLLKHNPKSGRDLFNSAQNVIRAVPIDKNSKDLLTPLLDFSSKCCQDGGEFQPLINNQERRIQNSGRLSTKRSVSETKKKYVASQQGWKCAGCSSQLDATFEVDHKLDLQFGGSNHVTNLFAVCRNCHGKKGLLQKIQ